MRITILLNCIINDIATCNFYFSVSGYVCTLGPVQTSNFTGAEPNAYLGRPKLLTKVRLLIQTVEFYMCQT